MKRLTLAMLLLAIVPAPAHAFVCKGAWRCTVKPNVNGYEVWGTSAVAPLVARCQTGRPVVVQHPRPSDVEVWGTSAVAPLVVRCR